MINSVVDKRDELEIIYNLLSERQKELEGTPHLRDEERFEQIGYLKRIYKKKLDYLDAKR